MGNHSIGKTIAALRKEKGWTQIELAEKLQVSDKAVSKWEQDNGMPSIEFFPAMAQLFGVSIDYLMTGQAPEKEIITMSKAELCAKNDDPSLLEGIDLQHKDENKMTLADYIVKYESLKVFATVRASDPHNRAAFKINDAIRLALAANRLDLLCGHFYTNHHDCSVTIKEKHDLLMLMPEAAKSNFTNTSAKKDCVLTDDVFKAIVCDKRINEETLSFVLGKQKDRQCVWYHVFPYLIHQAYINKKTNVLNCLLVLAEKSNTSCPRMGEDRVFGFFYVAKEWYPRSGHGFVRILEETIKLALDNGDAPVIDRFCAINQEVSLRHAYNRDAVYIPTEHDIRMSKLKGDASVSDEEKAIQATIHDGVVCINEAITLGNLKTIKKVLETYPVHFVEPLCLWFKEKNWRKLFEYGVDHKNSSISDGTITLDLEKIEREICSLFQKSFAGICENNINHKHFRYQQCRNCSTVDSIIDFCNRAKETALEKVGATLDKEAVISGLTKEYFESELAKGNIDIVIIKLCVRLEAILRCDYGYQGTFEEMLKKYCNEREVEWDEDGNSPTREYSLLQKLRKHRNTIVHSEANDANLTVEEIKRCIGYICKLG